MNGDLGFDARINYPARIEKFSTPQFSRFMYCFHNMKKKF